MKIESICPDCETPFTASEHDVGKIYVCRSCGIECIVPSLKVNPGETFGSYEVQYPIGCGASSEVHLAIDQRDGKEVALKIMFFGEDAGLLDVKRFFREARNVASLEHPGLIKIYEMENAGDRYYLAMEFVNGQTLDKMMDDHGTLPELDALSITRDVASVLKYAWDSKQLVHRDIKPANIMLAFNGRTKLMDLGIAKSMMYDLTQLTEPDTILGTPIYMSPEQCAPGKPIDFRADIYSMGATLYRLVTDEYPFQGKDPMDLVRKHLFSKLKDPRVYNETLSDASAKLIHRMMAKSANKRHKNYDELIEELDQTILELTQRQEG